MSKPVTGILNSIETFGAVDGPGVRYIVFLQGCPLRCQYCHNPETWAADSPEAYRETPEETFRKAWRYHTYWKNGGGITVSGGEALLQIDYVTALFAIAKQHGVHTALDTSGGPFTRKEPFFSKFRALCEVTDLFILDIKGMDPDLHRTLTGRTNENILDLARFLSDNQKEMWIRHVLVPGLTDSEAELRALGDFLSTLKTVRRAEILPYHTMGIAKYEKLGIPYPLKDVPAPTADEVRCAEALIK